MGGLSMENIPSENKIIGGRKFIYIHIIN